VFNSTCDENPSCRIICERDKHAQKSLQVLIFTRKNCIVVKLKMHNTESCCQKADTSTMLGILLPTGDISGGLCFIKKKKKRKRDGFHKPFFEDKSSWKTTLRIARLTFMNTLLSEMYIIKGIILEVPINALQCASYNNWKTVLILHRTLSYLHKASLLG